MTFGQLLVEKFRGYPFWSQILITISSLVVLIAIWTACGGSPPPPPLDLPDHEFPAGRKGISALAFSPDGKLLAAGVEKNVELWNFSSRKLLRTLSGQRGKIRSLDFSPDGGLLASASHDRTIVLWDISTGQEFHKLNGHKAEVTSVAFSPDGKTMASGSVDKTAKLWQVSSGGEIRTLAGHTGQINSIDFSPDGKLLATASSDKTVHLWDSSNGDLVRVLSGARSRVSTVAFSPDGTVLATGTGENLSKRIATLAISKSARVTTWDPQTGREMRSSQSFFSSVTALAFRPDGKDVAAVFVDASGRASIDFFHLPSMSPGLHLWAHRGAARTLVFSPDGEWLVSAGDDRVIRVWNRSR